MQARVPEVVRAYLRLVGLDDGRHPIIRQEFTPEKGWKTQTFKKRVSGAWCRKLRREGVTHVALEIAPGRLADFSIRELVR